MCSNYIAVTSLDRLLSFFGVEPTGDMDLPSEVYPLGLAPFIRLHKEGSRNKVTPRIASDASVSVPSPTC